MTDDGLEGEACRGRRTRSVREDQVRQHDEESRSGGKEEGGRKDRNKDVSSDLGDGDVGLEAMSLELGVDLEEETNEVGTLRTYSEAKPRQEGEDALSRCSA
jgi:hypothetical protein